MYIKITDLCNMQCEHCSQRSGPTKKHTHMTLDTYHQALCFAYDLGDEDISIGGGEPTVHPEFWEFVRQGLSFHEHNQVWLATNGKRKTIALQLAALNRGWEGIYDFLDYDDDALYSFLGGTSPDDWDRFSCELSLDSYHDRIDTVVEGAFKGLGEPYKYNRYSNIRNTSDSISRRGRASDFGLYLEDTCICATTTIQPNGDITLCGCIDAENAGTVWDPDYDRIHQYIAYEEECSSAEWKDRNVHND